jgi:hypothetical protein
LQKQSKASKKTPNPILHDLLPSSSCSSRVMEGLSVTGSPIGFKRSRPDQRTPPSAERCDSTPLRTVPREVASTPPQLSASPVSKSSPGARQSSPDARQPSPKARHSSSEAGQFSPEAKQCSQEARQPTPGAMQPTPERRRMGDAPRSPPRVSVSETDDDDSAAVPFTAPGSAPAGAMAHTPLLPRIMSAQGRPLDAKVQATGLSASQEGGSRRRLRAAQSLDAGLAILGSGPQRGRPLARAAKAAAGRVNVIETSLIRKVLSLQRKA